MKLIYVVILFLVFFNIFSFMGAYIGIFPYDTGYESGAYNLSTNGSIPAKDDVYENITGSRSLDIFAIFFADLGDEADILTAFAIAGVGIVAAWLTRSPAPLVLMFLANIVRRTYVNSWSIMGNYPVNPYITFAIGFGIIFLIIITAAEYLTQGDV